MNAHVNVMGRAEGLLSGTEEITTSQAPQRQDTETWKSEHFESEQIRGLVRRVFLSGESPAKHVVFSAIEARVDLLNICAQVAEALSAETSSDVAVVEGALVAEGTGEEHGRSAGSVRARSRQITSNLWRVPVHGQRNGGYCGETGGKLHWPAFLAELRREFEYAVIQSSAAAVMSEAGFLGQLTDGVILVLGAHHTRKATARSIKDALARSRSRILGTVLSQRTFPIPEQIYRRL
jgi:hypothetical protein